MLVCDLMKHQKPSSYAYNSENSGIIYLCRDKIIMFTMEKQNISYIHNIAAI